MARPRTAARLLGLALFALVASACQLRLTADVVVDGDGAGTLALQVAVDQELAESLAADGLDPFAAFAELPGGWEVDRPDEDPPTRATIRTTFDGPAGLEDAVSSLRDGLDAEDPTYLESLAVTPTGDGGATLAGAVGVQPPSSTGIEGGGIAFDGDALEQLLDERGSEVFVAELRVTMPGDVVEHDGDRVDGSTVVWDVPVGSTRTVRAVSEPSASRVPYVVAGAVVLVATALAFVAAGRRRR